MHLATRFLAGIISLIGAFSAGAAEGDGLTAKSDNLAWSRWQGRVSLGSGMPTWRSDLASSFGMGLKVDTFSVVGSYYFSRSLSSQGMSGGFRTTGGLVYGPRAQALFGRQLAGDSRSMFRVERHVYGPADDSGGDGMSDVAAQPYLGVGYTGLSAKGGWQFNADLGMRGLQSGQAVKFGRSTGSSQSLDDLLRDMRLTPILQLGVSYSF